MDQSSSNTLYSKYLEGNIVRMTEKNGIGFDGAFIIDNVIIIIT